MENATTPGRPARCRHRAGAITLGLGVLVAAAAGLAWATGVGPATLARHGCRAGHLRDQVVGHVHHALKEVDASADQEARILAILDAQLAGHEGLAAAHDELHRRALAALSGAEVDRAALEAVRAEAIRHADDASRELLDTVAGMAEVLTPAQRQRLAELARTHFE